MPVVEAVAATWPEAPSAHFAELQKLSHAETQHMKNTQINQEIE